MLGKLWNLSSNVQVFVTFHLKSGCLLYINKCINKELCKIIKPDVLHSIRSICLLLMLSLVINFIPNIKKQCKYFGLIIVIVIRRNMTLLCKLCV